MILLAIALRQEIFRIKVRDGLFRYRYLGNSLDLRRHRHHIRTAPATGDRQNNGKMVPHYQTGGFRHFNQYLQGIGRIQKPATITGG